MAIVPKKSRVPTPPSSEPLIDPVGLFGPALRTARLEKGVRLRDLSKKLDVRLSYLSDVERGRRDPLSNDRIRVLADYLDVAFMPLLEAATRDRGRVILTLGEDDTEDRVQAAALLSARWAHLTGAELNKLFTLLAGFPLV